MKNLRITSNEGDSLLNTFAFLRFPLTMMVVLCHSYILGVTPSAEVDFFMKGSFVLSRIVARVAVPNFLFISGYLFFRNVDNFTPRLYGDKLKRRLRSIVVPYLFWNGAVILLYFVGQSIVPQLFSGNNTRVCDYSFVEWVQAFWRVDGTESPINYPLWYMRNLMVMIVVSPLLYWVLKSRVVGVFFIATMLCLWLSCLPINRAFVWLTPKFTLFFSLGAWFALHKVKMPRFRYWVVIIGVLLYVAAIAGVFIGRGRVDNISYEMAILVGSLLTMYIAHYGVNNNGWRVPGVLSSSYFFIFVYHAVPFALLQRVSLRLFAPATNVGYFAIYFVGWVAILLLGIGLFHLLKRLLPRSMSLILGNRQK